MDAMVQRKGAAGSAEVNHAVVMVGGGCSGITCAAEQKRHAADLDIAIVEPSELHWYQPGWTMVGAGVFGRKQTERREEKLIPKGVTWIRAAAASFHPEESLVRLSDGRQVRYDFLIACPGLKINWDAIEGLTDTLGRNGVCSNYRPDAAEYTWELIKRFRGGTALFTQPAMPIKCAGAPQKILYLMADYLRRQRRLSSAALEFCLAGDALFGIPFFVPPLQKAIDGYGIKVAYKHNLTAIDGKAKTALFSVAGADDQVSRTAN